MDLFNDLSTDWQVSVMFNKVETRENTFGVRTTDFFLSNSKLSKNSLTKHVNPLTEKSNYTDFFVIERILCAIFTFNLNFKPLKLKNAPLLAKNPLAVIKRLMLVCTSVVRLFQKPICGICVICGFKAVFGASLILRGVTMSLPISNTVAKILDTLRGY